MAGLRILAVDDDPVILALLEKKLSPMGHRLHTVLNGVAALERLDAEAYDVVITDLMMPGEVDGIGVLQETKARQPGTEVLLLTAHASVQSAVEAMKKGAFDYLQKPINFDELSIILERIMGLQQIAMQSGELRYAMEITERNASETIGRLEMEVTRLRTILEKIKLCLQQQDTPVADKVAQMVALIRIP